MGSQFVTELFSSWKIIIACAGLMLLLPLLFYAASMKPRRVMKIGAHAAHPKTPKKPEAAEGEDERTEEPVRKGRAFEAREHEGHGREGSSAPHSGAEARGTHDGRVKSQRGRAERHERVETREEEAAEEQDEKEYRE